MEDNSLLSLGPGGTGGIGGRAGFWARAPLPFRVLSALASRVWNLQRDFLFSRAIYDIY